MVEQEQDGTGARKRRPNRVAFATAAVLALAAVGGASALIARAQRTTDAAATVAIKTERMVVAIEGMHCGGCASGIKAMLKRTPGVVSAEVSYEAGEANVEYDSAHTSREKIIEAITNMGYKATVKG